MLTIIVVNMRTPLTGKDDVGVCSFSKLWRVVALQNRGAGEILVSLGNVLEKP